MHKHKTILRTVILTVMMAVSTFAIASDYHFQTLGTRDGLTNNSVNALFVDSRGFLWIGTEIGLNRYDGYNVRNFYNYNNEHGSPITNITGFREDALGNMWIRNDATVMRYDYRTNTFSHDNEAYLHSLGFTMTNSFCLETGADGALWVVTTGKIQRKDLNAKSAGVQTWNVNLNISQTREWYLEDGGEDLLMTDGTKVWRFCTTTGHLQRIILPQEMTSDSGHLRIYNDYDGTLWVYSMVSEHICCVPSHLVAEHFTIPSSTVAASAGHQNSESNAIRKVFDDGQGQIWIATDHNGVFIYNKQERTFQHICHNSADPTSLPSDNVTTILCDRQGTVWMGHFNAGVSYSNERYDLFTHFGGIGNVSTMLFDNGGNLWLGTDGNGLFVRRADGSYEKTALPNITISSLLEDHNGTMWVGTYNSGLYRMQGTQQFTLYSKENGHLPHNSVWQMQEDDHGNIWYTSVFEPLAFFNTTTQKGSVYAEAGKNVTGISFATDGKGTIYCGTYYGIWVYDTHTGHAHYALGNNHETQKFLQLLIGPMCYDKYSDMLWLGHKTGITVWDTKRDTLFYIDNTNGMLDANIKGIVRDKAGKMWVSTDRGVSCIRTIVSKDGTTQFSIRNFTVSEGLQSEYYNTYSAARDKTGNVFFGGSNGYTEVNTKNDVTAEQPPVPMFTEVCLGDSIIPQPDREEWGKAAVHIDYDDYQLKVNFFTGELISTNRILYAYRLEGRNGKWTTTKDNYVSFFSLAPGNYTLEVKASGENGEWGEVRQLSIHVAPPFYLSWWMYTIYLLLALAALYLIIRYMHLRQQQRLEEQKVRMEQGQQIQLSEMKLRFFTNISHDLRTPLTLIISPLQSLLNEPLNDDVKKRLNVINKNAELLQNQVSMLLDFRRLDVGAEVLKLQSIDVVHYISDVCLSFYDYSRERNIRMSFTPSVETLFVDVDAEKLSKIVYNLLSNAFKFTPDGGTVDIAIEDKDNEVSLRIADSGKGVADADKQLIFQRFYQVKSDDAKAGSGIGLHIVNEYVRMHGGTVSVTDNKPHGAIFTVCLPKNRQPQESNDADSDANTPAAPAVKENVPFSVLVVDDNHDLSTFIADSLSDTYTVYVAADGEEALQQMKAHDINLVVSDIMMPKIDGLELCRRIKTDISTSHIPVILLTAKSTDMSVIEGLQQGADDYITKPFNIEHLKLRIQKFIEWSNNSHQTFQHRVEIEPSEITITSLDEEFIKRAIAVVEENITDSDFSVDTLGRELGMSRTYLYKKLSSITGKGPHDFIRTIRLKRAYRLLEKSQMQVSEIAYQVGYSSPKRFSENFKAEYGMTPSDFIRSHRA